jgi:major vault protein
MSNKTKVISIAPYEYIHVKDNNKSIIKVEVGPQNYIVQEHEELIQKVTKMTVIPPNYYVCIKNPVLKDENNDPVFDKYGQVKLAYKELEYRFNENYPAPFYLHYGEEIAGKVSELQFIKVNQAFKVSAQRQFTDRNGKVRNAGDEWLYYGPSYYYPTQEEKIDERVDATVIGPCEALRLKSKQAFTDRYGEQRKAGEEWLVRKRGAFIPDVYESVIRLEKAIKLTNKQALHLTAVKFYKDVYGKEHRAGEEWLILPSQTTWHVIDVFEKLIKVFDIIILTRDQYAIILNPVDSNGKNQKGARKLIKGEESFFLQPGEELEQGIQSIKILNENEAVLLQAKESFIDENKEERVPGDKWMIKGPTRFIPPIEVEILENRHRIPLDEREGIYVRDTRSGTVRSVIGKSYLLESYEELWEKELSQIEEEILSKDNPGQGQRDRTRVVCYKCPYNTVMQIYNFKTEESRIIFGPDYVMLEPDEQFCLMFLSGKTPKIPGIIKTLYLNMGPTYTTDKIEVETSDHALLDIEVAYNWFFDVLPHSNESIKIFSVRDCIGEMCSIMASKVRGAVAELNLNQFHKNSARTIRKAVMGETKEGKINDKFIFENNMLAISNVDIKEISTKDQATMEKLKQTVNLAIQLTTKSQEEEAKREADSRDQEAKALLKRMTMNHNSEAEVLKRTLYQLVSNTKALEERGTKEAEAVARANAGKISANSQIEIAKNNKELNNLKQSFRVEMDNLEHNINMDYMKQKNEIELNEKEMLSQIESLKFQKIIDSIGKDTLIKMSEAGPESQVKLLQALGLEGFVMTDGNNPINLFNFANNIAKGSQ